MTKRIFKCILLASLVTLTISSAFFIAIIFLLYSRSAGSEAPTTFWGLLAAVLHLIIILTIAVFILSVVFAGHMSKRIVKPINELSVSSPGCVINGYPELDPLTTKLRRQNALIKDQMTELERRHNEFNSITEGMSEGFIIVDRDMNIISFNSAACEIFSFNDSSKGFAECKDAYDTIRYAADGHSCEREFELGGRFFRIFASPVSGGVHGGAVAIVLDITERAQREAMRREFSTNISHELKTPLTTIHGAAEMLKSGMVKPDDTESFGTMIYNESDRLITLVQDILRISQIDEGSMSDEDSDVDIFSLSQSVVSHLTHIAARKSVTITLDGNSTVVRGSEAFLEDIVYNLIDNAVKYNKENGSVNVFVKAVDSHPVFEVTDTGIGIPQDQLGRIFERFYRVDKSRSKAIGGTGLGLSIVRHAAAYHNADISIESEPNVGTKVTVTFP